MLQRHDSDLCSPGTESTLPIPAPDAMPAPATATTVSVRERPHQYLLFMVWPVGQRLGIVRIVAGLVLAWWTVTRLLAAAAADVPRAHEVTLDWRVFAFLFGLCTIVGLIVGLAPALIARRQESRTLLQGADSRSTMTGRQRRLRCRLWLWTNAIRRR